MWVRGGGEGGGVGGGGGVPKAYCTVPFVYTVLYLYPKSQEICQDLFSVSPISLKNKNRVGPS